LELAPDERIPALLEFDAAGLFALQLQPIGAAPVELFAEECQDRVAQEQGQQVNMMPAPRAIMRLGLLVRVRC
jgi:hypothetical protein